MAQSVDHVAVEELCLDMAHQYVHLDGLAQKERPEDAKRLANG